MPAPTKVHIASTDHFSGTVCGQGQRQEIAVHPSLATCDDCREGKAPAATELTQKVHYQGPDDDSPYCNHHERTRIRTTSDWVYVTCWKCINYSQKQVRINKNR